MPNTFSLFLLNRDGHKEQLLYDIIYISSSILFYADVHTYIAHIVSVVSFYSFI